jgi:hypothetical protein
MVLEGVKEEVGVKLLVKEFLVDPLLTVYVLSVV